MHFCSDELSLATYVLISLHSVLSQLSLGWWSSVISRSVISRRERNVRHEIRSESGSDRRSGAVEG